MKGMHKMAFLKKQVIVIFFVFILSKSICGSVDMKVGNSSLKGEIEGACCTKKRIMFFKSTIFYTGVKIDK